MKTKIIAMYLPQYHETEENNRWWGKGFTDWVSTKNAEPLFPGHLQPRAPLDENYYDLSLEDFLREYEAENKMDNDEYLLFLIKLAIPKRIEFTKNTYLDCYHINNYLVYLRKIAFLVQKLERIPEKV